MASKTIGCTIRSPEQSALSAFETSLRTNKQRNYGKDTELKDQVLDYIGWILLGAIQVHSPRLKVNSSTSKINETRFFHVITDANVYLKRVERRHIYILGTLFGFGHNQFS